MLYGLCTKQVHEYDQGAKRRYERQTDIALFKIIIVLFLLHTLLITHCNCFLSYKRRQLFIDNINPFQWCIPFNVSFSLLIIWVHKKTQTNDEKNRNELTCDCCMTILIFCSIGQTKYPRCPHFYPILCQ